MKKILKEWAKWSISTFPNVLEPLPPLLHLKEEVNEAIKDPDDVMEYADIIGLCVSAWVRVGTIDELEQAIQRKLEINKQRNWKETENQIYHHK